VCVQSLLLSANRLSLPARCGGKERATKGRSRETANVFCRVRTIYAEQSGIDPLADDGMQQTESADENDAAVGKYH